MPQKPITLAAAIQRLRTISGESQQFFGARLRISTRALQQYEAGKIPEPRQLVAFAAYADAAGEGKLVELFIAELERQLAPPPGYYSAVVFRRRELIPTGPDGHLDVTETDPRRGLHGRNR
jgi:transcriptional regulator with XRE-family HTH domain